MFPIANRYISLVLLLTLACSHIQAQPCPVDWGPTSVLSSTPGSAFVPKMATAGDTVHLIYHDGAVYYRRSIDGGSSWKEQLELVPADSMSGQVWKRPIAASRETVALVWGNRIPSGAISSIKIRRSTDAGETWLDPQILAVNEDLFVDYLAPMVASRGNEIFVTVHGPVYGMPGPVVDHYFLTRSCDNGVTWDSLRQITTVPENHSPLGDLEADDDGIYLTFERATDPSGREIAFTVSTDSGTTWSEEQVISTIDNFDAWEPNISSDGAGGLFLTWQDAKYGSIGGFAGTLLLRTSTDQGMQWTPEINISVLASAVRSSIVASPDMVHIVWDDERNGVLNGAIHYRGSTDGGLTWCPDTAIGDTLEIVTGGEVAWSPGKVHVAYSPYLFSGDPAQVFYRRGSYSPTSVSDSETELPDSPSARLIGNFPNPFNGQTVVRFEVFERQHIHLSVFDLVGREVLVLADEVIEPGAWNRSIEARGLSSGTYFIFLRGNGFSEARPIAFIK